MVFSVRPLMFSLGIRHPMKVLAPNMGNILLKSPRLSVTLPAGAEDRYQDRVHTCGPRRSGIFSGRRASSTWARSWTCTGLWTGSWTGGAWSHRSHHRNSHRHTDSGCADPRESTGSAAASGGPGTGRHSRGRSGGSRESPGSKRTRTACGGASCRRGITRRRSCAGRTRADRCRARRCSATPCTTDTHRAFGGSRTGAVFGGSRPACPAPRRSRPVDSRSGGTGACICGDADARRERLGSCAENPGI